MSKKSKKRFFMKRVEEREETVRGEAISENVKNVFPHNARPITARILLNSFFIFFSYFGILFFLGIVIWSMAFPLTLRVQPIIAKLTYQPLSAGAHLDYLSFLVSSHRLYEASQEARLIAYLKPVSPLTQVEQGRLNSLTELILEKQQKFTFVVDSYLYWKEVSQKYPEYRDGLYMYSLYSYMLFDESSAKNNLFEAISLDPQFEAGKVALSGMEER